VPWPPGLAAQVAEIQKLLPATGANAIAISACFGKRSKPREAQIAEILETLRSLGKLE
jgi:N-methylhydantoinase A/oxoprolinase/acetone carboxylase beta subunit